MLVCSGDCQDEGLQSKSKWQMIHKEKAIFPSNMYDFISNFEEKKKSKSTKLGVIDKIKE